MIHLVDLPSFSSLKAWMHSGATETLGTGISQHSGSRDACCAQALTRHALA